MLSFKFQLKVRYMFFFYQTFENYLKKYFINKLMIGEVFEKVPFEIVEQIIKTITLPARWRKC